MENLNETIRDLASLSTSSQSKLELLRSLKSAVEEKSEKVMIEDVEGLFRELESLIKSTDELAITTIDLISSIVVTNKDPVIHMYLPTLYPALMSSLSTSNLSLVYAVTDCVQQIVGKELKVESLLNSIRKDGVCASNPLIRSRIVDIFTGLCTSYPRIFDDSKCEVQALHITEEISKRDELKEKLLKLKEVVPVVGRLLKKLQVEIKTNCSNKIISNKNRFDIIEIYEFGIIPSRIINDLQLSANWKRRVGAIEELEETISIEKNFSLIQPHLKSFLLYLIKLLDDPNYKIVVVTLQIVNKLLLNPINPDYAQLIIPVLIERLGDTKAVTRQLAIDALRSVSKIIEPSLLVSQLIPYLTSPKSHIREQILNLLIILFIENSNSLNAVNFFSKVPYKELIKGISPLLADDKPRIAQVAFEAYATIGKLSGTKEILSLLQENIHTTELFAKLQYRIKNDSIPILNNEGVLEFPIDSSFTGLSIAQYNNLNNVSEKYSRFTSAGSINRVVHKNLFENKNNSKRPQTNEVEGNVSPRFGVSEQETKFQEQRIHRAEVRPVMNAGTLIMGIPFSKESNRTDTTRSGSTEARGFGERFKFLSSAKPFDVGKNALEQQLVKPYSKNDISQRRFCSLSSKTKHSILPEVTSYLSTDELTPLLNPETHWLNCVKEIKCFNNPAKQFESCNIARRLCINHSMVIADSPLLLRGFIVDLLKLIESQKMNLAKNTLLILNDLYNYVNEAMEDTLEIVLPALLKKGTEPGSFLGPHVVNVLKRACNKCTGNKVLAVLMSMSDMIMRSNSQIKLRVIQCLDVIRSRYNKKITITKEGEKIVRILSELLSESSTEVRNAAKEIFVHLSEEANNPLEFQGLVRRAVNSDVEYNLLMSKISFKDFPVEAALESIRRKPPIGQRNFLV